MRVELGLISGNLEVAKYDIISFVSSFDADISGENGEEYTLQEALDKGYDSTIKYLVFESDATDVEGLIVEIMEEVKATYYDYGTASYEYIHDVNNNQYVVTFAVAS